MSLGDLSLFASTSGSKLMFLHARMALTRAYAYVTQMLFESFFCHRPSQWKGFLPNTSASTQASPSSLRRVLSSGGAIVSFQKTWPGPRVLDATGRDSW